MEGDRKGNQEPQENNKSLIVEQILDTKVQPKVIYSKETAREIVNTEKKSPVELAQECGYNGA